MAFRISTCSRVPRDSKEQAARLYYQVFDLLNLDGQDLTLRPLLERKQRLRELLLRAEQPRLRYVAHVQSDGAAFFRAVDELGLEGIVCKRARSVYRPGIRSADWIKVKCFRTQRFAIVGYTMADDRLESLAVAGRDNDGALNYAGRVEWGVPRRDGSLLRALRASCKLSTPVAAASRSQNIAWVEPHLSAEVRALAWMPGRALRHAVLRSVTPALP